MQFVVDVLIRFAMAPTKASLTLQDTLHELSFKTSEFYGDGLHGNEEGVMEVLSLVLNIKHMFGPHCLPLTDSMLVAYRPKPARNTCIYDYTDEPHLYPCYGASFGFRAFQNHLLRIWNNLSFEVLNHFQDVPNVFRLSPTCSGCPQTFLGCPQHF